MSISSCASTNPAELDEQRGTVLDLRAEQSPPPPILLPPDSAGVDRRRADRQRTNAHSPPRIRRLLGRRKWSQIRLLVDVLVLAMAASAALAAAATLHVLPAHRWPAAMFPLSVLTLMRARHSPDERLQGSIVDTTIYILGVSSVAAMMTISLNTLIGTPHAVVSALLLWLFTALYLTVARAALMTIRRRALRMRALTKPTLIIGAGAVGGHLTKRLLDEPGYGLRPVGYLDSDPLPAGGGASLQPVPLLGGPDELPEAIAQTGARHVIVAFSSSRDHALVRKVRECEQLGVGVSLIPRLYESINERSTLDHIGGLPVVTLHPTDPRGGQFAVKHALDRLGAALALLALSPLMAAIAIAVRAESAGSVLFRQRRVGRDGREFYVFKFRTMREHTQPARYFELPPGVAPGGVEGEDRRTRVGRLLRELSLDELPQLINVLRGEMSLIGPRPERPEYVQRFARDIARYDDRHRVKSGITGWAQVHGLRGQTSIAERVELDNYYIQNWSLRLDFRIMLLTLAEVLRFRG